MYKEAEDFEFFLFDCFWDTPSL